MNGLTIVAVACALATTVGAYRNGAIFGNNRERSTIVASRPIREAHELQISGHRIGPESAALTIVEFADFECPACASYAKTLLDVRKRHPRDFAVAFHHFPLPYHKLAYPLARAGECAASQGKFTEYYDAVYSHPENLGVVPVSDIGLSAGVTDTLRFRHCLADTARVEAIERDLAIAKSIKVPATPGLVVNGQLLGGVPLTVDEYETLIKDALRKVNRDTVRR